MSALSPAELLTIDVDAELRKLGTRWVPGEPERAVELARLLLGLGASELHVSVGRRRLELVAAGARLPAGALEALVAVGDVDVPAAARHEALSVLEGAAGLALVGLATADSAELLAVRPDETVRWSRRGGAGPVVERGRGGLERLELRLGQADRGVVAALRQACAYARALVRVNGEQVSTGRRLRDCLLVSEVTGRGFAALVGLPRGGQLSRLTLLVHDVIERDVYRVSRHGFVNTALVWLEPGVTLDGPLLADVDRELETVRTPLLTALASGFDALPPGEKPAARELLVRRARAARDLSVLGRARLFARAAGGPLDVEGVRALAASGGVWATAVGERGAPWSVEAERVLRLERRELELLREVAGLALHAPPRVSPPRVGERLGRRLRRLLATLPLLRPVARGRAAPPDDLVERLRLTVEREVRSGRFELPGLSSERSMSARVVVTRWGRLPLRARASGNAVVVHLPRRHAAVARLAGLLARDGASLRPVMAALFGGHDGWARAEINGVAPQPAARP